MEVYELIYDYCHEDGFEDYGILETVEVKGWGELKKIIKQMRQNGCYNINASYLYSTEEYGGY